MADNPYVFISYAHHDSVAVLPCIATMKQSGINLWYDEGIEAGSEWPEFIAEKVMYCSKFVLFVSNAYLNSQNCKRELNFAISRKKEILSIYLEDVKLSPGMEMQLGTYQAIFRKRFENDVAFQRSVSREIFFNPCRTNADNSADAGYADVPPNMAFQNPNPGSVYGNPYVNTSNNFDGATHAYQPPVMQSDHSSSPSPVRNKTVAALLALFLGAFGIHKFYLRRYFAGILYLIFCSTGITWLISLIDGIVLLCSSKDKFERKYKCRMQ